MSEDFVTQDTTPQPDGELTLLGKHMIKDATATQNEAGFVIFASAEDIENGVAGKAIDASQLSALLSDLDFGDLSSDKKLKIKKAKEADFLLYVSEDKSESGELILITDKQYLAVCLNDGYFRIPVNIQGELAERPGPGVLGRFFFETLDGELTGKFYIDNGQSWQAFDPQSMLESSIQYIISSILNDDIYGPNSTWSSSKIKAELETIKSDKDWKDSVRVATSTNIELEGIQTVSSVLLNVGDRVLVKNQDVPQQNNIYIVQEQYWTIAEDTATLHPGFATTVDEGDLEGSGWLLAKDLITWIKFSSNNYTFGIGFKKTDLHIELLSNTKDVYILPLNISENGLGLLLGENHPFKIDEESKALSLEFEASQFEITEDKTVKIKEINAGTETEKGATIKVRSGEVAVQEDISLEANELGIYNVDGTVGLWAGLGEGQVKKFSNESEGVLVVGAYYTSTTNFAPEKLVLANGAKKDKTDTMNLYNLIGDKYLYLLSYDSVDPSASAVTVSTVEGTCLTSEAMLFNRTNKNGTDCYITSSASNHRLQIEYAAPNADDYMNLTHYTMIARNDAKVNFPKTWVLEGSIDKATWVKIHEVSEIQDASRNESKTYSLGTVDRANAFKVFRFTFNRNQGQEIALGGLQLFAFKKKDILDTEWVLPKKDDGSGTVYICNKK